MLACREVNEDPSLRLQLEPLHINPGGRLESYRDGIQFMLDRGIAHVCGCYTSSSRKEVLPLIEKRDALLWYPSHYEGFETSQNVVYTGSSPNQHLTAIEALMALRPKTALRRGLDGAVAEVSAADLVAGDPVVLRLGARMPADGMIAHRRGGVDEAHVTGESMPVSKAPGDRIFEGTVNLDGVLDVTVTHGVGGSTIARII